MIGIPGPINSCFGGCPICELKSKSEILRCPKTVTGKHIWRDKIWKLATGERSGSIVYDMPYKIIDCMACGLIDDRKDQ